MKHEELVVELVAGIKMLELGLPARLLPTSLNLVEEWNKELKAQGYFTKAGSVPRAYFEKKCYGFSEAQ